MIEVAHREADVAYPILVDPELETNWSYGNIPGIAPYGPWQPYESWSNNGMYVGTSDGYWPGQPGLYFTAQNSGLAAGAWDQVAYFPPNEQSYISRAVINIFHRGDSCSPLVQDPYDYTGMYTWNNGGTAETPHWNGYRNNDAYWYGNSTINSWGNEFVIGFGNASAKVNACWRRVRVGGTQIWLEDWQYPYLSSVGATPEGWTKKDATNRSFNVSATDAGLGVKSVRMFGAGTQNWWWNQGSCTGTWESPCGTSRSGQITFTTNGFPLEGRYNTEGKERKITVQVEDPTQKTWQIERPLWVDGVPPTVNLKGQLATQTDQVGTTEKAQETTAKDDELSLPTYKLEVEASDGADRSGVQEIKVYLDKDPSKEPGATPTATKSGGSCPTAGCAQTLNMEYTLRLPGLEGGKHSLWIVAVDKVGNTTPVSRNIEFEYIPATGMKEEYVLQHFRLPDGNDYSGEAEYHGPEIAVNVMNGNVVFHERDVAVEADRSQVDLERVYNSQQPTQKDTQWGRGFSIAQTPEFEPQAGPTPQKATMTEMGKITNAVTIPQSPSQSTFSSKLRALITKTTGGYEVEPAGEDEVSVFSVTGRIEEVVLGDGSPVEFEPEEAPIFASSFGSSGSGNGQLDHPADTAVDAKGNVWVVDRINNRIVEFDEAGNFVRTAGSMGSSAGQLKSPSGIAIDTLGNISVTDTANNRITRFNENGQFDSIIGWNVNKTKVESGGTQLEKNRCIAWSGHICQAGTAGTAEGQISEPIGITTTGGQNLFVVERANNRVEKFSPQAEVLAKFGSAGSGAGQLKEPAGIAYTPIGGGYLWVADTGNNRIQAWTTSYAFSKQVGKEGSGQVEFKKPVGIEADAEGNVFVGDLGNQRVQELSRGGDFLTRFGGSGEFELGNPSGIFLDSHGALWVTDAGKDQVQQWLTGSFLFAASRIGSFGTGNGQFSHPADVALDGKGNVWALDKGNNRLEKFNEKGEFVQAVGAKGGAAGQLNGPSALAIDPSGNLWVADSANNRIVEFNEKGEFVLAFGRDVNKTKVDAAASEAERNFCTAASGNICQAGIVGTTGTQLNAPQGIASTTGGNIWVADTGNSRLKKYNPTTGALFNNIGGEGSGSGQVKNPTAIDVAADNSLWVADSGNNRIEVFNSAPSFLRQFGSEGSGDGQFKRPAAIDVDTAGNLWVGDQNNSRIQQFNSSGEFVSKFGNPESFRFSGAMGLVADGKGSLWVTDTDHNRLQRRSVPIGPGIPGGADVGVAPYFDPPVIDYEYSEGKLTELKVEDEATQEEDPSLDMSLSSGLVTEVASEEAGDTNYGYESGKLKAIIGIDGETKYGYDSSGRMNSVTLPNGTVASITYDSTSRATSVKVDPAGPEIAKTTNFFYSAEPRRTTVWGGGSPEIVYDIGEDGSVLKWQWAETPPTIASMSGSLISQKALTIEKNKDQTLFVTGSSPHGIGSIKVLTNGNSVAVEERCEDTAVPPDHHCDQWTMPWVTSASDFAPGRLDLEVIVTDLLGHQSSERFFVFIPQPDPPDPNAVPRPNFDSIKLQREESGLDLGKNLSNYQLTELILELLYEWESRQDPPMRAVEQFGVPMRQPELSEMEYRRNYVAQASEAIPNWAEANAPSTYGGYYVDERAGGIIRVGFTGSPEQQAAAVQALKNSGALMAPARVEPMPVPPPNALVNVESLEESVGGYIDGNPSASSLTDSVGYSADTGKVVVESSNPAALKSILAGQFGAGAPIEVVASTPIHASQGRYHVDGIVHGGDYVLNGTAGGSCTANYSGYSQVGSTRGESDIAYFKMTAGHCGGFNERFWRKAGKSTKSAPSMDNPDWDPIGRVNRSGFANPGSNGLFTDAIGIATTHWRAQSSNVYYGNPDKLMQIYEMTRMKLNRRYCWSGVNGGLECGRAYRRVKTSFFEYPGKEFMAMWIAGSNIQGDSGAPVWDEKTGKAVGLLSGGADGPKKKCVEKVNIPGAPFWCPLTLVTPLLPFAGKSYPIGAMQALGVGFVSGS
ncbi:MAG: hypothetical protein ACJ76B_03065 [Solirubrobacterales bacterium]